MEGSDYLFTAAEIAAALAGFAALIVALGDARQQDILRGVVPSLIERSLVAILLSLFPALLEGLGAAPRVLWGVCSGTLALYVVSLAVRSMRLRRHEPHFREFLAGPVFYALYVIGLLVLLLQIAHAADLLVTQSVWWYLVGLTWLLASICYLFFSFIRAWARSL
jgi:hypothetical protein